MMAASDEVTVSEVQKDPYAIMEFLEYLRFMADENTDQIITVGTVWAMFTKGVRDGQHWSEVADDLGIPQNTDWY